MYPFLRAPPLQRRERNQQAILLALARLHKEMSDAQKRPGRIASIIQAGSTDFIALNLDNTRAAFVGGVRRSAARCSRADYQEVIRCFCHSYFPLTLLTRSSAEREFLKSSGREMVR